MGNSWNSSMDDSNIFGPGLNLPWNIHELRCAPPPCIQLPKNGFVANEVEKQPLDRGTTNRRVRKNWRWIWFLACSRSVQFFRPLLYPNHWSQRVLMGAKWKIWILSFHWYPMVYCRSSGFATTASQSQAIFQNVQKCWKLAYLASSEIPIFGHFFSNGRDS